MKTIYQINGETWCFDEQTGTVEQIDPPDTIDRQIATMGIGFIVGTTLVISLVLWLAL